jgi:hypothetical protein
MEPKKGIGVVYGLVLVVLSLFIVMLICFAFFGTCPQYDISSKIIILICFLLVIALSCSFDNFSIGKLISISREAKENKERAEKLEKEKNELILKIANFNVQSQSATNNLFLGDGFHKKNLVKEANEEEIKAEEKEEDKEEEKEKDDSTSANQPLYRRVDRDAFRTLLINKYFGISKRDQIERNVKLETRFQNIDPISNEPFLFHAHLDDGGQEYFIRVVSSGFISVILSFRVYAMLSRIYHYRIAKKTNACLVILYAKDSDNTRQLHYLERFANYYSPSIESGLLKIQEIELSKEEMDNCKFSIKK